MKPTQPKPSSFVLATLVAFLVAATSAFAVVLPPENGLVLWLKADSIGQANGTPVTDWADSSGNHNDAVLFVPWSAIAPEYIVNGINGRPAVGFGSAYGDPANNDKLFISNTVAQALQPISLPAGLTIAGAFSTTSPGIAGNFVGGGNFNPLITDSFASMQVGLSNGVAAFNSYGPSTWNGLTGGSPLNNTNVFAGHWTVTSHSSGGSINLYADWNLVGTTNYTYNGLNGVAAIGQGYGGGNQAFQGLIGEILVYNRVLSPAEVNALNFYLASEWQGFVPEPSTVALLGLGGLLVWWKRKQV